MDWTLREYALALEAYKHFGAVARRVRFNCFIHRTTPEVKLVLYALRDSERKEALPDCARDVELLVQDYARRSALVLTRRTESRRDHGLRLSPSFQFAVFEQLENVKSQPK